MNVNAFDYTLTTQPLPSWLLVALKAVLLAPNFEQALGQTIGISDPDSAGGNRYALAIAHALLCATPLSAAIRQQSGGMACGHCEQCALLKAGNHPDLMCLVPESLDVHFLSTATKAEKDKKPSKIIKIEQLRALEPQFVLSSQRGGRKVVVIYPAETLGIVPANALLKTLEEPPPNTFFIVVSSLWSQILPTLRSRCVCHTLPAPSMDLKLAWLGQLQIKHPKRWLELSAGKVDMAISMAQDPLWLPLLKLLPTLLHGKQLDAFSVAQDMAKAELSRVLPALNLWIHDVLAVAQGAQARFFGTQQAALLDLTQTLNLEAAGDYALSLIQMNRLAEHPLNARAQCEALLLEYKTLFI